MDTESYKHNSKRGNEYTYKNLRNVGAHKARIWKVKIKLKGINQNVVIKKCLKTWKERSLKQMRVD